MKRLTHLLMVSILGGAITLGAYKLFFENSKFAVVTEDQGAPYFTTSNLDASVRGAGINEVDFTVAAEKTVNAVVHVKNVTVNEVPNNFWEYFYGSQGSQRPQVGTGSGVIISPDGYIVTNNHVIAKADALSVTLNNNKSYKAEIIGTDPNSDIALIKIDADRNLPYLAFGDSDNTRIGEWVLAVGNPFNLTSTVTAGIISAKARDLGRTDQSFLQTDAAVNPGNSGGALVNTNGDLIGINTAITSQTGSYVGYSFAVPSNIAKKVVEDIMEYGNVQKGILGISSPRLNTPYAVENGIDEIEGVYIDGIEEDSGAEEAELKSGDVIKMVDDIRVRRFADLTGYVATKRPGDKVLLAIDRNGDELEVEVELKERQSLVVPQMGLKVKNLNEEDKKKYKTKYGVKITGVPETYRGYDLEGKVIMAIGDEEVRDIQDARTLFGAISRYGKTVITMINEKGERERLIFQ
ncbi:trypsin-like peptidase domain-containing protein [Zeaxanthinibacter enoshimensis]|uniref:Do/DeqQ family serine protease n=1 Tax=Zeaxanthinibacter enoshimensis TaxID=392009 RepID=A0A4R6TKZ5_9FLAO|nr:trypsin-like peptidase domain-containing protein [Zeaxanthinibacter enoshimensis]TDQ31654.1 Do/DeqQ family serine protease [Zeaxanthinibacter enoshimensis]